jgi:hypothetical protein
MDPIHASFIYKQATGPYQDLKLICSEGIGHVMAQAAGRLG